MENWKICQYLHLWQFSDYIAITLYGRKVTFLHLLQSSLNLSLDKSKYDCFGGENNRCLCLFTHIWKFAIKQRKFCPNRNKEVTKSICPPSHLMYNAITKESCSQYQEIHLATVVQNFIVTHLRILSMQWLIVWIVQVQKENHFFECRGVATSN